MYIYYRKFFHPNVLLSLNQKTNLIFPGMVCCNSMDETWTNVASESSNLDNVLVGSFFIISKAAQFWIRIFLTILLGPWKVLFLNFLIVIIKALIINLIIQYILINIFFSLGFPLIWAHLECYPPLNLSSRWAAPWWEFLWPGPTSSLPVLMAEPSPKPIQPLGCALVGVPLTWAHLLPSSPYGWALPWTYPAIGLRPGGSSDGHYSLYNTFSKNY